MARTLPTSLAVLLGDPEAVALKILRSADIYGLLSITVRLHRVDCVVLEVILGPWAPMAAAGYPTERIGILVSADGRVLAVPHRADERRWLHRFGDLPGRLCLWFDEDPRALRWEWEDGFEAYLTIVHRHLQAEEYWRRHGAWPGEDAPHGKGPHPIKSWALRKIAEGRAA